jgi:hypothetical protein
MLRGHILLLYIIVITVGTNLLYTHTKIHNCTKSGLCRLKRV